MAGRSGLRPVLSPVTSETPGRLRPLVGCSRNRETRPPRCPVHTRRQPLEGGSCKRGLLERRDLAFLPRSRPGVGRICRHSVTGRRVHRLRPTQVDVPCRTANRSGLPRCSTIFQTALRDPSTIREIWIVLGKGPPRSELEEKSTETPPSSELFQLLYSLQATWTAVTSIGARLRVFSAT